MKKPLMILLTFVFILLSIVGIILPMLPATPFLVLSAYFASKSSPKLQARIVNSKMYQNNIGDFVKHRAMTHRTKKRILLTASLFLVLAFVTLNNVFARCIIVFAIVIKYYVFIFKIETLQESTSPIENNL